MVCRYLTSRCPVLLFCNILPVHRGHLHIVASKLGDISACAHETSRADVWTVQWCRSWRKPRHLSEQGAQSPPHDDSILTYLHDENFSGMIDCPGSLWMPAYSLAVHGSHVFRWIAGMKRHQRR